MNKTTELIPVSEVARRLHVCKHTAYQYLSPGGWLHHLRVPLGGRTIRVDRTAFENMVAAAPQPKPEETT